MTATFTKPTIITRKAWGALPSTRTPKADTPKRIVLHHSWDPKASEFHGAETIRGIQRYHQNHNQWDDIGYHYLVAPKGDVYAGRPVLSLGAHCGGNPPKGVKRNFGNTGSIGICVIGNYDIESPTKEVINSLVALIMWLESEHNISHEHVFGHCEAWSNPPKTCPGKNLMYEVFGAGRWSALKF